MKIEVDTKIQIDTKIQTDTKIQNETNSRYYLCSNVSKLKM